MLELGTDGRLLSLQLDELVTGVDPERELVIRDYLPDRPPASAAPRTCSADLETLAPTDLVDVGRGRAGARPRRQRAPRRRGHPARLPAAGQGAAAARRRRRPAGRALRQPAEAALGQHRRPAGRRRRRRAAGPAASARACPGWPSRASSSATSEPARLRAARRACDRGSDFVVGLLDADGRPSTAPSCRRRRGGDRRPAPAAQQLELHVDRVGAERRRDRVVEPGLGPRRGPGAVGVGALAVPGHVDRGRRGPCGPPRTASGPRRCTPGWTRSGRCRRSP